MFVAHSKTFQVISYHGDLRALTVLVKTCHSAGWCVDPRIVP